MERSTAKLTISIIAGLVVVPLAAVMAVALMSDTQPTDTTLAAAVEASPEVQQVVFGAVAEATSEDLAAACGPAGMALVTAEADKTITPLQQAALDALRPICEGQGTPLPGKTAPDPIVQTVTRTMVAAAPAPAAPAEPAPSGGPETTQPGQNTSGTGQGSTTTSQPSGSSSTTTSTTQPSTQSWESQYYTLHDQAETEIANAIAAGGDAALINEAQQLLAEAESKASHREWHDAAEKAWEAVKKARAAVSGGGGD